MTRVRLRGQKIHYHHGDLRRGLMDAATTLIDLHGRHALTMRGAARRVGVSEAAPYRHFTNLDELLGAVALEGYDILISDLEAAGTARAIRDAYLAFAGEFPGRYDLMFSKLKDRKAAAKQKEELEQLAELTEAAGGLAGLHGEAALRIAELS